MMPTRCVFMDPVADILSEMRIQLAMNVRDLHESIAFYSKLFGAQPLKSQGGLRNWALEDPPLKFVIVENDTDQSGTVNHLGVEVDSAEEVTKQESRISVMKASKQAVSTTRFVVSRRRLKPG